MFQRISRYRESSTALCDLQGPLIQNHFHEGYVIGVIKKGQLEFDYRGKKLVASAGDIKFADPGEVHKGFSVSDFGWQNRYDLS